MSKYQTALNLLKGWARNDRNAYIPKHLENINNRANVLQELVDKAKPKKLLYSEEYISFSHCPNCKKVVPIRGDYCPHCGQAIDWRVEDEKL